MDGIALMYAEKIICLVMRQSGIPWESPFGFHEFDGIARETFDVDIALLVIGLAEGYWKRWLVKSKREMRQVVKRVRYERYIRNFLSQYFEVNTDDDMVNVLTMIMYIVETSVQLYSRNVTDAPVVGVTVLAEVLLGETRNQEEMGDRFNRLHASANAMMCDPNYYNLDTLQCDS